MSSIVSGSTRVLATGRPTWDQNLRLVLERNGFPEECWFTFSYSPLFDADGVGGVLEAILSAPQLAGLLRGTGLHAG